MLKMSKKIMVLAGVILVMGMIMVPEAGADVPKTINIQGILEEGGSPVTTAKSLTFEFWNAATGGSQPFPAKTISRTPDERGFFNVALAVTAAEEAHFSAPLWVQIKVGTTNVGARQPLQSVPYALRAAVADALPGVTVSGGRVGIGTSTPATKVHVYPGSINLEPAGTYTQSDLNMLTKGDGAHSLNNAATKGWHWVARGDNWGDGSAAQNARKNDLELWFWDGTAWLPRMFIDCTSGDMNLAGNLTVPGTTNVNNLNVVGTITGAGSLWTPSGSNIYRETGNVGIGTTDPKLNLDVYGEVRIDSDNANYDVWIQGGIENTATSALERNLALLGKAEGKGDQLFLNYNNEYSGGTMIESEVRMGWDGTIGHPQYSVMIPGAEPQTSSWTYLGGRANNLIRGETIIADNANAYVGIGTTDPQAKLHVAGDLRVDGSIQDSSGSTAYVLKDGDTMTGRLLLETPTNVEPFRITQKSGTTTYHRFVVDVDGNVGTRVDDPTAPFQVSNYLLFGEGGGSVANGADIRMTSDGVIAADGNLYINSDASGGTANKHIYLGGGTANNTANTVLSVMSYGRVGINTKTPGYALTILKPDGPGNVCLSGLSTGNQYIRFLTKDADLDAAVDSGDTFWQIVAQGDDYESSGTAKPDEQGDLYINRRKSDNTYVQSLFLDGPTGNVGVGLRPETPLHVAGQIRSNDSVNVRNPANSQASVTLGWLNNTARLRYGGEGDGSKGGFRIERPGDKVILNVADGGYCEVYETATDSDRYGYYAVKNFDGSKRGFYLGYGSVANGVINFNLDDSDSLYVSGGDVHIGGQDARGDRLWVEDGPLGIEENSSLIFRNAGQHYEFFNHGQVLTLQSLNVSVGGTSTTDLLTFTGGRMGFRYATPRGLVEIGSPTEDIPALWLGRNGGDPSIKSAGWLIMDSTGNSCALNYYDGGAVVLAHGGGRVGIKDATSPGAGLHLKAANYPESFIFLESNAGLDTGMRIYEGGAVKYHIYHKGSDDKFFFDPEGKTGWAMDMNGRTHFGGHVPYCTVKISGIDVGYTSGGRKIHSGAEALYIEGDVIVKGAVWREDPSSTYDYVLTQLHGPPSARRFKTDIRDYQADISKLGQLRPVKFKFLEGAPEAPDTNKDHIGLIAEEVENVYPELVSYYDSGEIYGVDYEKLSIILLQEIKDLRARVAKLEAKEGQ
jgi:hypothetical protein